MWLRISIQTILSLENIVVKNYCFIDFILFYISNLCKVLFELIDDFKIKGLNEKSFLQPVIPSEQLQPMNEYQVFLTLYSDSKYKQM